MNQNRFRALAVSVAAAAVFAPGVCGLAHAQGEAVSGLRSVVEQPTTGGPVVVMARAEMKQWMW
ncbi:hypothetical protein OOK39_27485 [Streptomyces sp. NBC_00264]|uniref:hypothetical protein n=1 Tax=unclassified Streptomyces TaxID=2593676 RepID=UPI00225179D7|nr:MULTISPECIES: hypothetical protein [unclassified Streptomyces]MCX5162989.1 hypothetical protein [Streptomyces sp. NBC_00305]MCX5221506.1 hypothetical protein [Streptomyces sp. NBC_00264]